MNIIALIPARMGSSRFPGKPMAELLGMPMVGHVYHRVSKNKSLTCTAVATCDKEIYDYITSIGGVAVMTSDRHERASDRSAEALDVLEEKMNLKFDIVVMVQGDEPMTHPEMITEAIQPLLTNDEVLISNLLGDISSEEEFEDRNCIKVVCDQDSNALYFSREPIPTKKMSRDIPMKKQVCIIPFRREFLTAYTNLAPTPLEVAESVDMMRVLEHGMKVKMIPTKYDTHAVDTTQDLERVSEILKQDSLVKTYL